ncbi:MrcB family domain-containing protein [Ruegeria arenilitoris]|uniref:MrcB family domain-containing protein n=1 Tax=Ruegeria arenilitoris TaxID=1173585 RepID=UPI00147BCEA4|nr:DUF3578 domain-containing protein [Ruegeria arenilitoris]
MRQTLRRICELQLQYSSKNTPEMQERGNLVRQVLTAELRALRSTLSDALGPFGADFHVDASDGIGNKTELPWARFCSKEMSPKPTHGFYVVLHFSTDGSGVNIAVGCSSSKFHNGYSIILPPEELAKRTEWARRIVQEDRGTLEPFTDSNDFGARLPLPKSFQNASALVKKITYDEINDAKVAGHLVQAAEMLRAIYSAQRLGRELSPADQTELDIINITRPTSTISKSQGFGLTAKERIAVERRAMAMAEAWLLEEGYKPKDTSANKPYDFEAKKDGDVIFVEVKGTTSDAADAIAMTHGEVALHRSKKGQTALIIVTGIRLEKDRNGPRTSGGKLEPLVGWDIDEWSVQPTAFRVARNANA